MDLITRLWNALIEWAEEIHEYRRKNGFHGGMY